MEISRRQWSIISRCIWPIPNRLWALHSGNRSLQLCCSVIDRALLYTHVPKKHHISNPILEQWTPVWTYLWSYLLGCKAWNDRHALLQPSFSFKLYLYFYSDSINIATFDTKRWSYQAIVVSWILHVVYLFSKFNVEDLCFIGVWHCPIFEMTWLWLGTLRFLSSYSWGSSPFHLFSQALTTGTIPSTSIPDPCKSEISKGRCISI